jgi:hypothetical protein
MRILILLILFIVLFFSKQQADSPHGKDFKISCVTCHSSKGWQLDRDIYSFNHNTTKMPLLGQHKVINCRQCHPTLVFKEAKSECIQCHNDIHQATTGSDCSRCHTPESWLVKNITEIHQRSRFPLVGAHRTADCIQCHKSETMVRFDVPGINCIDCHRNVFMAATNPNHIQSGFSEDCAKCHPMNSFQWSGAGFNHNFFPLSQGHSIPKCADCHITVSYSGLSRDCNTCHNKEYAATTKPNHVAFNFPETCGICHSLSLGWIPASYSDHDNQYFPITSGRHKGKWTTCDECHLNPSDYKQFNCIICHKDAHRGRNYTDAQCYSCHPNGSSGR